TGGPTSPPARGSRTDRGRAQPPPGCSRSCPRSWPRPRVNPGRPAAPADQPSSTTTCSWPLAGEPDRGGVCELPPGTGLRFGRGDTGKHPLDRGRAGRDPGAAVVYGDERVRPHELERRCERVRPTRAAPNIGLAVDADVRHGLDAERAPAGARNVGLPRRLGGEERREVATTW